MNFSTSWEALKTNSFHLSSISKRLSSTKGKQPLFLVLSRIVIFSIIILYAIVILIMIQMPCALDSSLAFNSLKVYTIIECGQKFTDSPSSHLRYEQCRALTMGCAALNIAGER